MIEAVFEHDSTIEPDGGHARTEGFSLVLV